MLQANSRPSQADDASNRCRMVRRSSAKRIRVAGWQANSTAKSIMPPTSLATKSPRCVFLSRL